MIKALPEKFLKSLAVNDALQRYLDNLVRGKQATPRSWLYENKEPDDILGEWMATLSTLRNGDTFRKEVYQFDTSQLEKWGPQGEVKPIADILESIVLPTYESTLSAPAFNSKRWSIAKKSAASELRMNGIRGIRPASYSHVIDDMRARDTLESNSGWPDFARRNLPEVKAQAIQQATNGDWKSYPAITLFRNYNQKTRLVWMFPMSENLVESTVEQPWLTACMKSGYRMFAPWIGFDEVRRRVTEVYASGRYVYASDFSSTDAHFKLETSRQVLDAYSRLLSSQALQTAVETVEKMHSIPLIIGPEEMITGEHGLASGSVWTNFLETLFDIIFCEFTTLRWTATRKLDSRETPHGLYAIGDDIAWSSQSFSDAFDEFVSARAKDVGQVINAEKVSCHPDKVKTLQRLFQRGYSRPDGQLRAVYSTIRALKSSVYPERFHKPKLWSSDMFCARQYMILENCVDHPLFEEFVKFVVRGQRDLIPFARKSRQDLDRILRETKLLPGFNPTYNQERRDQSLGTFASIAIAKGM